MMNTQQSKDFTEELLGTWDSGIFEREDVEQVVDELRRLQSVNTELLEALNRIASIELQIVDELRRLQSVNTELLEALNRIASIELQMNGGDWDEITEAQAIAEAAIARAAGLNKAQE